MRRRAALTFTICGLLAPIAGPAYAQSTGRFPDPPSTAAPTPAPVVPPVHRRAPGPRPIDQAAPDPMIPSAPPAPPRAPAPTLSLPPPQPSMGSAIFPPVLPYREGAPIPAGYRLVEETNSGLMVGGLMVELAGYVAAFAIGAAYDFDNGAGWLIVPVIGPWAALGARENPCAGIQAQNATLADAECVNEALDEAKLIAFLTVDGMVQMIGTGLIVAGALTPRRELVRTDVAGVRFAPIRVGEDGLGLSARGVF